MSRIRAVVVVVAIVLTWLLLVTVGCSGDRSPSEGHEARSVRAASSSTTTPSADTSTPAATSSAPSSTAP